MIYIAQKYLPWFQQQGVNSYKELLAFCESEGDAGELINNAGYNTTWRVSWKINDENVRAYLKRYRYSYSPRYAYPRKPRALVEMKNYLQWQEIGVMGPEVIAAGAYSPLAFHRTSLVITREISQAENLNEMCLREEFKKSTPLKEMVFDQLASLLVKAHKSYFYHFDLHFRNIMVQENHHGTEGKEGAVDVTVYWIDSPRGLNKSASNRYLAVKDLACLLRGCYEQQQMDLWARLFDRYCREMDYDANTAKELTGAIRKRLWRREATREAVKEV